MTAFDASGLDDDTLWHEKVEEGWDAIEDRARAFVEYLKTRPETHIAVVSHGVFLYWFWSVAGLGGKSFSNCELGMVFLE